MKKMISHDLKFFALLVLLSCGVGFCVEQMRANPLGLSYRTPAQRLIDITRPDGSQPAPNNETTFPISREIQVIDIGQLQELLKKNQVLVFEFFGKQPQHSTECTQNELNSPSQIQFKNLAPFT